MAFDFNPITGQLDLVDSPAGYINGVVADSSLLPVTLGAPPLDAVYLAKAGSGLWLIARKPAGMYVRVANNGVAADWTYLGAFPEVNAAANWEVYGSDTTKRLKFNVDGLPTATLRTVDAPAGNGRMLVEGQPIGNTTPAAGTFTTLSANNGTITASAPVLELSQTWNNAAVAFTALRLDITNTASLSAGSGGCRFLDFRIGGTSQIRLERNFSVPVLYFGSTDTGLGASSTTLNFYANGGATMSLGSGGGGPIIRSDGAFSWSSGTNITSAADLSLARDAADTLAQRRTTNPQTFRLYNTFTDASNHERGFMRWSSNVLQIGTEKAGTGSVRNLDFQIDGTSFLSVRSNAVRTVGLTNYIGSTGSVANVGFGTIGFAAGGANNSGAIVFYDGNGGGISTRFGLDANNVLAIRSTTVAQSFRIYNTYTGSTSFERLNVRWDSNELIIDAESGSAGGTLRGIKLGSASTSLLGFYGATPVVQQAAVADATDAASTQARLNDLLARLRTLGLIAT